MEQPDTSAVERDAKRKKVNLAHWRGRGPRHRCAQETPRGAHKTRHVSPRQARPLGLIGVTGPATRTWAGEGKCQVEAEDFLQTNVEAVCAPVGDARERGSTELVSRA